MTAPPGHKAIEESIPATQPVSGSNLPHIPRKWIKDAIRTLTDAGYAVSGAQAWNLLKEWQAWRRSDAERFIADEFRTYAQRRGDLIQVKGRSMGAKWAVTS